MLFFLVSFLSFLLILAKPFLFKLLPSWVCEMRLLLVLLCQEAFYHSFQWLKSYRLITTQTLKFPLTMIANRKNGTRIENVEVPAEAEGMILLDLPELALECILRKLPPSGLCRISSVCTSLRDRGRSDHLWEKHLKEKWGRFIGKAAEKEWELYRGSRRDHKSSNGLVRPKWWLESLSWFKPKQSIGGDPNTRLPVDSVMAWYLALESGRFWIPAQVYNRENGHVGFMLSCYDAELSYDSHTNTFHARYPPHGHSLANVEEGVKWERLRAPSVDTPAHDLHLSDCLNDLRPGDHIEIQWRRNKEFPYGWWYGVVGHLELCDRNENRCHCFSSDTVILEFNQYTPGSRWRRTTVNRKGHREEGGETDGFYGGIMKICNKDDISMWRQLWPKEGLE